MPKKTDHLYPLLEANRLISRKAFDSFPPRVEYSITEHGFSLEKVIYELRNWAHQHRNEIFGIHTPMLKNPTSCKYRVSLSSVEHGSRIISIKTP